MTVPVNARAEAGTLLRFLAVGSGFSLFYAIASAVIINTTTLDPFIVSVVLFVACIPFAFLAQQHLTFRAKKLRDHAFCIYASTQIGSIAVVSWITTRFVTYDLVIDTLIMGLTVGIAAVVSFLIGRLLTFKQPS